MRDDSGERQYNRHGLARTTLAAAALATVVVLGCLPALVWPSASPSAAAETAAPSTSAEEASPIPVRRVNAPRLSEEADWARLAVLWFGEVTPTSNSADVRVGYEDWGLLVYVVTFDRRLWRAATPGADDLAEWDAVSLYLDLDGDAALAPGDNTHRFVVMLSGGEDEAAQTAYRGNGSGWVGAGTPFSSRTSWRGSGLNDGGDDRGWTANFYIPFASLGLSAEPPEGTVWRMGLRLHDRDDAVGTPIPDQTWPEAMAPERPDTWGQLSFGLPAYTPPAAEKTGAVAIRQGPDGVRVPDADVGGTVATGTCAWWGEDTWTHWGRINYGHSEQVNVQNQGDVADWPCFSKYYVTFPLDAVPRGKAIVSATLTMHQFGNAGQCEPGPNCEPQPPRPSWIQVLVPSRDWHEETITWNNAPLAAENVGGAWVDPLDSWPGWPGVPRSWDVSRAVAEAYAAGQPVRLVLYSADWGYHSGKYFVSSDVGDWNVVGRPALHVEWGEPLPGRAPAR